MIRAIIFFALTLACGYSLVLLVLLRGLFRTRRGVNQKAHGQFSVSVVVAARNEEESIADCLRSLLNQDYPEELYEVILVDDDSIDNTLSVARSLEMESKRLKLLNIMEHQAHDLDGFRSGLTGKQNALDMGIRVARGEIILTTDADCKASSTWVQNMVREFKPGVGLIAGFSLLDKDDSGDQSLWRRTFLKLQSLETLSLYIGSVGSIAQGFAWAGTGNNMAYRREVYDELGGFEELGVTGAEDSMLLQWVDRESRWKVKPTLTTVYVKPMRTVPEFLEQRNRWASSSLQNRPSLVLFMILVYLLNASLPVLIGFCVFGVISCKILAVFLGLKIIPEFLVVLRGLALFNRMDLLKYFLLLQPFHVIYVLVCGIHGVSKGFVWKGRKYREGKAESEV